MNFPQADTEAPFLEQPTTPAKPPITPLDRMLDRAHKSVAENPDMKLSEFLEWQDRRVKSGKWSASTDEERWNSSQYFNTREEALAYAVSELAVDNGLQDGRYVYTGQIDEVTSNELANVFDAERLCESMADYLNDNVGECDDGIDATREECTELERRVYPVVEQWLREFDLTPKMWRLLHVKSHLWEQCTEVDSTKNDPAHHPRCVREKGHLVTEDHGHDFQDEKCDSPTCACNQ